MNTFEFELFTTPPFTGKYLQEIEQCYAGSLYKWASTLQYFVQQTKIDFRYATMRLSDVDLGKELRDRRSTTSLALLANEVVTRWDILKQGKPTGATTRAELFALHKGVFEVKYIRNFSASIGYAIGEHSIVYEGNAGTIKVIVADRITPTHRHHYVKISSVIYHEQKGTIAVSYSKTDLMSADPNTTPHGGNTLKTQIDRLI
eukprot:12503550-Ditylum_brightwellii.AAC.1